MILVAGGAFILGHKSYVTMLCRALRLAGILCIAVDYRYWPQSSIDGMVDDVNCAVQWCFDNAGKYGGDPKCISLLCCIRGVLVLKEKDGSWRFFVSFHRYSSCNLIGQHHGYSTFSNLYHTSPHLK